MEEKSKDIKFIALFGAIGLALAYVVSAPLRRPAQSLPRVGTPLEAVGAKGTAQVYAEGTIDLGPGLTSKDLAGRTLFIIAKAASMGKAPVGGPPVGVQRVNEPAFPYSFALTTDNNMIGGDFYEGDLVLTARLDKDGMAGPKQPDDYETSIEIKAGQSRRINLVISR